MLCRAHPDAMLGLCRLLLIVPGRSLVAGACRKAFATVTVTSSAWSCPSLRGT